MKLKKVLAILMASAMIMGMSLTTFAAPVSPTQGARITINQVPDDAIVNYLQIVKPNNEEPSGWEFTNDDDHSIATAFIKGYLGDGAEYSDENARTAIEDLLGDAESTDNENVNAGYSHVDISNILLDLTSKAQNSVSVNNDTNTASFITAADIDSAGLYLITVQKQGYTSVPMLVYVDYEPTTGALTGTTQAEAKISDNSITKKGSEAGNLGGDTDSDNDDDQIVAIGDIVTYEISMRVPYVSPEKFDAETAPSFIISDEITGATYENLANATIKMDGETVVGSDGTPVKIVQGTEDKANTFTVDLSSVLNKQNSNANKEIVITYNAKVTEITVNNTAKGHTPGSDIDTEDPHNFYTGQITMTKYNEKKKDEAGSVTLAGAGFEVSKGESVNDTALHFKAKNTNEDGEPIPGAYIYDPTGGITEVFTGDDGTLIIEGLDVGTYWFTEKTAPEGYSINATPSKAVLTTNGSTEITQNLTAETDMTDTKLSSLPSTGGIGTTIFTVGGCAIMIAAAGLYFASRRKQENK